MTGRALTLAEEKRTGLDRLYHHDTRVAPRAGTAHGVLQAVNTYEHHDAVVRGTTRPERKMLKTITGDYTTLDRDTWHTLSRVLAA